MTEITRRDIEQHFLTLVEADDRLSGLSNDAGVLIEASTMGYKVDDALNQQASQLTEFFYPTSEMMLLSMLLHTVGYVRLPSPMVLTSQITSNTDRVIDMDTSFTTGADEFLLLDGVVLESGVPKEVKLSRETLITKSVVVSDAGFLFKIDLSATHKEISRIECFINGVAIKYSQQFTDREADFSLSIDYTGELVAVFSLGNERGNNIQVGDTIDMKLYKTYQMNETPDNLSPIADLDDVILEDVAVFFNGSQPMCIREMQDTIKYNKNIAGTLLYNEDYRNFILSNIDGLDEIKVWHQAEEDSENGVESCNINKVFVSYIPLVEGEDFNDIIDTAFYEKIYGKPIVHVTPLIVDVSISISIIYNTKRTASSVAIENIKTELAGYYDGRYSAINDNYIYEVINKFLGGINIDVGINVTGRDKLRNRAFHKVVSQDVNISTSHRT